MEPSVGEDDVRVGDTDRPSDGNGPSALESLMKSSFGPVLIALGPAVIYVALSWVLFLALRPRIPRVYSPKALKGIQAPSELSSELPAGWITWIKPFLKISDTVLLDKGSLDSFLFLRHVKTLCVICVVGICFIWPILLPIHKTGGRIPSDLTIPTEDKTEKYYAHVVVCWFFTGFILFMVYRECVYFINIRHAYFLSSNYTQRVSSKVILYTCVPSEYLDEKRVRKLFGDSVVNFWAPNTTGKLKALIKEREKTAVCLEEAEITLIKRSNAARSMPQPFRITSLYTTCTNWIHRSRPVPKRPKLEDVEKGNIQNWTCERRELPQQDQSRVHVSESQGHSPVSTHTEYSHPCDLGLAFPETNNSPASQRLKYHQRPSHHVLSKLGRRVDTIEWARLHLKSLEEHINELRQEYQSGTGQPMNAVFNEFDSCANAQAAYQMPAHHQPSQMSQPVLGVRPGEIIWSSLRIKQWQRLVRQYVILVLLIIGVAIWWLPTYVVSIVTNPDFMRDYSPALATLPLIPAKILSGLGRAILLVVLLETVPFFLRACAKFTGEPTLSAVESFVQTRYFVFQVVQVFLAPSAIPQVIFQPTAVLKFWVPLSSSFYYTYILVQCLQASAWELLQFVELFRHQIKAKSSRTPQDGYKRWHKLNLVRWGGIYPVFTNVGVMAISYAFIAPLILAFSVTGLCCVYFVYKYNLIYVYDTKALDTAGAFYPRAVMQLTAGLYLAQMYLVGLFAINSAWVQMSLMVFLFISTVFIHVSLRNVINPLLRSFPRTLSHDGEGFDAAEDMVMADCTDDVSQTTFNSTAIAGHKSAQPDKGLVMTRVLRRLALPSVDDLQQLIPRTPLEKEFPD
ncbi:hypothetical protein CEP53_015118, partial [Fusarium sp. AF-6]